MMCAAVSRAPQLQFGGATLCTRHWKRKALSPIFPVRIWVSVKLSCFLRVLCFCSALLVKSGLSAGSLLPRHIGVLATALLCSQRLVQSLCIASSVDMSATHWWAHCLLASPPAGSWRAALGRPLRFLRRRAIAVHTLHMSSPFPVALSRVSKSASHLLR